jgi:hypothetical protein
MGQCQSMGKPTKVRPVRKIVELLGVVVASNGLELSCPAEAGIVPLLYGLTAGDTRTS